MRRAAFRLNAIVAVMLAAAVLGMVNYLAGRFFLRWDVSSKGLYRLSDKTLNLVGGLPGEVRAIAFFQRNNEMFDKIESLVDSYRYASMKSDAPGRLVVEMVDPDRDLARARELTRKYGLDEANIVVFEHEGRKKIVRAADLIEVKTSVSRNAPFVRGVVFRGEQVFSSAIHNIVQAERPVMYFLAGHGEHEIDDYGKHSGYSTTARALRRENIELRTLRPGESRAVPEDCDLLAVAGPDRKLSSEEVNGIAEYLAASGRLLALMDPAVNSRLEGLLESWGARLEPGVVVDGETGAGRKVLVDSYGDHEVTRSLKNAGTVFYMPRPVQPVVYEEAAADRPRATVLAESGPESWIEMDLNQSPARFDEGVDRPGPAPVAVAVERGVPEGIEIELKPTRIVVAGDSYFISNGALDETVGGNLDLLMNSVNWLLEREELLAIAPKAPDELRLGLNPERVRIAFGLLVGALPLAVILMGLCVLGARRS